MAPRDEDLLAAAARALARAHAPYSRYRVGAAVRAADGAVYTGVNVENASYGLTVCAERHAVAAAVAAGATRLTAAAVVADGDAEPFPCGACRQVLAEFMDDAAPVAVARLGDPGGARHTTLGALLPHAFRLRPGRGGER